MTDVEVIKQKLNIADIAGTYVKLEKSGLNYRARCPFHSEKTPSFFISPDRGTYYCFGCGVKGDIFSLVEQLEGIDFREALISLADRAGITLTSHTSNNIEEKDNRNEMYRVLERATIYFQSELAKNHTAQEYLRVRGLTNKTIEDFRIGFAPDSWRSLHDILLQEGYSKELLVDAGLIKHSGNSFYDRFRGRIMFPIADTQARIIGFSGRILTEDSLSAKYLNSPETVLFKKSEVLYGIDKAKKAIREVGYSVLVEGQLDLILSHQAGVTHTVASSGTAVSDVLDSSNKALAQLYRLAPRIVLGFDADKAGIAATYRTGMIATKLGFDIKVVSLPHGKDPADIIKNDPEEWKNILKQTERLIFFFAKRAVTETKTPVDRARYISEKIIPLITQIPNVLERDQYIKEVALLTDVDLDALRKVFTSDSSNPRILSQTILNAVLYIPPKTSKGEELLALIGLLNNQPEKEKWYTRLKDILGEERFQDLIDLYTEHKEELLFKIEKIHEQTVYNDTYRESLFTELHIFILKEDMAQILREIKVKEKNGLPVQDLMNSFQEKRKLLETLS